MKKLLQCLVVVGCMSMMTPGFSSEEHARTPVEKPPVEEHSAILAGEAASKIQKIDTALFDAVRYDDAQAVRRFISLGANVNERRAPWNMTPLLHATQKSAPIATALVKAGADVNAADRDGVTVLMKAAQAGNTAVIEVLLSSKDLELDARDKFGETALVYAVVLGRLEIVEALIEHGADVNLVRRSGETPLVVAKRNAHYAKESRDPKIMRHGAGDHGGENHHQVTFITKEELVKERMKIVELMKHAGAEDKIIKIDLPKSTHH